MTTTIYFECPHCGIATRVETKYAGDRGPCRNCGQTVVIPGTPAPEVARKHRRPPWGLLATLACVILAFPCGIGAIVVLVRHSMSSKAEAAATCQTNLKKIVRAMEEYESDNGSLPPAYIAGPDGKPMHSWRVLLLEYMGPEEQQIFRRYRMDEPWNGPNNSKLLAEMPDVYACPWTVSLENKTTSYVVVVGPETAFEGGQGVKKSQVKDGPASTVYVIDMGLTDIKWLEPRDVSLETLNPVVGSDDIPALHEDSVHVGLGDGTVQEMPQGTDLTAWLTKAAGDQPSR
ncbi:MAG: DUF1559 domain-containing protein [Planctomycetia bacterium]|nr:DUF1559 domain-containing protein [Planctomycetia bacterium]